MSIVERVFVLFSEVKKVIEAFLLNPSDVPLYKGSHLGWGEADLGNFSRGGGGGGGGGHPGLKRMGQRLKLGNVALGVRTPWTCVIRAQSMCFN